MGPAGLRSKLADGSVFAIGAAQLHTHIMRRHEHRCCENTSLPKTDNAEGMGNDLALHCVVRGGDTIENLKAAEGGLATGSLVRKHAADDFPNQL